jgi:hypothetical protein
MIAVAVAVIAGVVAVTCGIVADSNHADNLTFLGVMVKTTAAQIFLTGAICTWALFAALWLLSLGVRRSKERTVELRALRAGLKFAFDDGADIDGRGPDAPPLLTMPTLPAMPPMAAMPMVPMTPMAPAATVATPPVPAAQGVPTVQPAGDEPTLTEDAFADHLPFLREPPATERGHKRSGGRSRQRQPRRRGW